MKRFVFPSLSLVLFAYGTVVTPYALKGWRVDQALSHFADDVTTPVVAVLQRESDKVASPARPPLRFTVPARAVVDTILAFRALPVPAGLTVERIESDTPIWVRLCCAEGYCVELEFTDLTPSVAMPTLADFEKRPISLIAGGQISRRQMLGLGRHFGNRPLVPDVLYVPQNPKENMLLTFASNESWPLDGVWLPKVKIVFVNSTNLTPPSAQLATQGAAPVP